MKIRAGSGVYAGYYRFGDDITDTASYAAVTGKQPAIAHLFFDWTSGDQPDAPNPALQTFSAPIEGGSQSMIDVITTLGSQGVVPSIAWSFVTAVEWDTAYYTGEKTVTITIDSVINGQHDDYIRSVAQEIKATGVPIMLSPFGEIDPAALFTFGANGTSYYETVEDTHGQYGDPTIPDGPERIKDMYKHVVDIFNEEGVDNVTWYMYTTSHSMITTPGIDSRPDLFHPQYFYPGDEYIDWVGQSAYFIDPQNPPDLGTADPLTGLTPDPFFSFVETFSPGYNAWAGVTDKPFFIPEFAFVANEGQDRSALIESILSTILPEQFPNVKAITILDDEIGADYYHTPRIVGATAEEIDAFQQSIGQNPYYLNKVILDTTLPPLDPLAGDDVLEGTSADDYIASSTGDDIVKAGKGHDVVEGEAGDDALYGECGDDALYGGEGEDTLTGGRGDDYLDGGDGHDVLRGGRGNDILIGGDGYDTLYGGEGEDVFAFIFDLTDNFDTVDDFDRRNDTLYLGDILDGTTYNAGAGDDVSDFLFAIAYEGNTYLAMDVDGQGGAGEVYFASLENVTGLGDIDTMIANWQVLL